MIMATFKRNAQKKRGRKAGYESTQRKLGCKTKVARIPAHWNLMEIHEGLEMIESLLAGFQERVDQSAAESRTGSCSNRFEQLEIALEDLRAAFPKTFNPQDKDE